jgi:hypothetical protein
MRLPATPWRSSRAFTPFFLIVAVAVVGWLVLAPRSASAQTVALTAPLGDYLPNGQTSTLHPPDVDATWISYADCEANVYIQVPITLTPPAGGYGGMAYALQAWVAANTSPDTDCGNPTYNNPTTGVCWQVLPPGAIALAPSATPHIFVRDLLARLGSTSVNPAYPNATVNDDACHTISTAGAIPINLQFIWVVGTSEVAGATSLYIGLNAELIGPEPPSGVDAGVGDGILLLGWTPSSDPTTKGYSIFVDPLPGHEGEIEDAAPVDSALPIETVCKDAGFSDGGIDDAGDPIQIPIDSGMCTTVMIKDAESVPANNVCPSTVLVSGVSGTSTTTSEAGVDASAVTTTSETGTAPSPQQLAHLYTTLQNNTATQYTLTGLKDGYTYTVAVAAVDNLEDNGPLSPPTCATPSPISDFWTIYRDSGGLAGGGYCALDGVGAPTGAGIFGVAMATALFGWVRRRRQKHS